MRNESYKDTNTSRGLKYHYYFAAAHGKKPTLVFCHGFPSTSKDWKRIIPFLEEKGYGVIVPDMLGYGGTDKPEDYTLYKSSYLAQDILDILDAEGIQKAIGVGHGWGSLVISRLATAFPERFYAYAFFALGYEFPLATRDYQQLLAEANKTFGYDVFGYWDFFASDEGAKIYEETWYSTGFGITFPKDPLVWKNNIAPLGAIKAALLSGEEYPLPDYLTEEDKKEMSEPLIAGGFAAQCSYYKVAISKDIDDISSSKGRVVPPKSSPIFYGAALQDYICTSTAALKTLAREELKDHKITVKEYQADHWLILSEADAIKRDLSEWVENVVETSISQET
ncbi:epoxide hydrolase [Panus rudis PR-1116 ss-1]|nr:epoxide hydrolase [Panus rudis PR-1116 ss-1]